MNLKLSEKIAQHLADFPEQGMGYQIVDVKLTTGKVLENRFVFNCEDLQLNENESITLEQIDTITIH